jgi:serine/threonine-protein kinase RsbT
MDHAIPSPAEGLRIAIASESDLVRARQCGREAAQRAGLSACDSTLVATAISELARNMLVYASEGEIWLSTTLDGTRQGITVVASDGGPGIDDIKRALEEGYSSSGGLGLGLPGVRRIMDEFEIDSAPGRGTVIKVTKWK